MEKEIESASERKTAVKNNQHENGTPKRKKIVCAIHSKHTGGIPYARVYGLIIMKRETITWIGKSFAVYLAAKLGEYATFSCSTNILRRKNFFHLAQKQQQQQQKKASKTMNTLQCIHSPIQP